MSDFPIVDLMLIDETKSRRVTRTAELASYFRARPWVWVNCLDLEFAGRQAWRSRLSNLRFAPYRMTIKNRQMRVPRADGRGAFTRSEYRFEPDDGVDQRRGERGLDRGGDVVVDGGDANHGGL